MLVKVWEKKFDAEVRALDRGDVNQDGIDEIVLACWDSRVYLLSGSGEVIWTSKKEEYPCENVSILYNSIGKPYLIVASCHKKVLCLDTNANRIWTLNLDSWISGLYVYRKEGYPDRIIAVDLKRNIYFISPDDGQVLWSAKEIVYPWLKTVALCPHKNNIIVLRGQRLSVFEEDGKLIKNIKLRSRALAIDNGVLMRIDRNLYAIGFDDGVEIYDEAWRRIQRIKLKRQGMFRIVKFMDVDMDGDDELIVGSWLGHKITIYKACLLYTSPSPRDRG